MSENGGFMIAGEQNVARARWLAVRSALKLEIRGLRGHGRPKWIVANEITGNDTTGRGSKKKQIKAYDDLNDKIVEVLGEQFDLPLPENLR